MVEEPEFLVTEVATFGATCSPSSAQFIKNKYAEEFAEQYPAVANAIIKSHYVDDYLDSVGTVEEAVQLWKDVRYVYAQGEFEMRGLISSFSEAMQHVRENGNTAIKSMNLVEAHDKETKTRRVRFCLLTRHAAQTKRQVLITVMCFLTRSD